MILSLLLVTHFMMKYRLPTHHNLFWVFVNKTGLVDKHRLINYGDEEGQNCCSHMRRTREQSCRLWFAMEIFYWHCHGSSCTAGPCMLILLEQIKPEEGESTAEIYSYAFCRTLVWLHVRIHNNIAVSTKSYQTRVQNNAEQVHGACGISAQDLSDRRYIRKEHTRNYVHKKYSRYVCMYVCM